MLTLPLTLQCVKVSFHDCKKATNLVDHPVLEVVTEGHDAHLVDHVQVPRAVEVQDRVERPNRVFVNKLKF